MARCCWNCGRTTEDLPAYMDLCWGCESDREHIEYVSSLEKEEKKGE